MYRVEELLGGSNSFMDLSVLKESKLFKGDVGREDWLESISQDFGYNLVEAVA